MIEVSRHSSFRNFRNNLFLSLSSCAFISLLVTTKARLLLALAWYICAFLLSFFLRIPKGFVKQHTSRKSAAATAVLLALLGSYFYACLGTILPIQQTSLHFGILRATISLIGILAAAYFGLALAAFIAVKEEDAEKYQRFPSSKAAVSLAGILTATGLALAVFCSFNGYIWADEAYSLRIVQYSYSDIVAMCAADVHPPFYYLALKLAEDLGTALFPGYYATVVIGKLFSVVPYLLLIGLCWYKLRDEKVLRPYVLLCVFGMPQMLSYSVEIRMYSWALLFVTASFFSARDIVSGIPTLKNWALLAIFSIFSAYSHDFALICMASIWLCLLIWILAKKRDLIIKWLCFGSVVGICFFPWFLILLRQVGYVAESYWIPAITWEVLPEYILFIFSGFSLLIPFVLVLGTLRKETLFQDGFGILVPVITIAVGVIASLVIRPLFVARYMVPGLMSLWISVLLLSKKCNAKARAVVLLLVMFVSVDNFVSFVRYENLNDRYASANMELVDSFEDDAILIVSNDPHVADVIASYTPHMVYTWRGEPLTTATTKYREAYKNEGIFDDAARIDEWLDSETPLYYFEVSLSPKEDLLPVGAQDRWFLSPIGEYSFENPVTVYQIQLK